MLKEEISGIRGRMAQIGVTQQELAQAMGYERSAITRYHRKLRRKVPRVLLGQSVGLADGGVRRTWPHRKLRRKVPRVDGALTVPPRVQAHAGRSCSPAPGAQMEAAASGWLRGSIYLVLLFRGRCPPRSTGAA